MKKVWLALEALQKGKELSNPAIWKKAAVRVSLLTAFLLSVVELSKSLGYDTGLNEERIAIISSAIAFLFDAFVHVASTKKIGLSSRDTPDPDNGNSSTSTHRRDAWLEDVKRGS